MAGSSFGKIFRITTFGESHGVALGVIIDGCPAGIEIDIKKIQVALNRRRPGNYENGVLNPAITSRIEEDKVECLSGVFQGKSEGTPIALIIYNKAAKSNDYDKLVNTFRPGHADWTYFRKYGIRDFRGGGRSSGRETAARVAAGSIAQMVLEKKISNDIKIIAFTKEAAGIACKNIDFSAIEKNVMKAADMAAANSMLEKIAVLKENGDSTGGIIECQIKGVKAGLGEPVFDKLDAMLSHAMISIGAVKGIEFGLGFGMAKIQGSKSNDAMTVDTEGKIDFLSNNAGGILGGISNGNDIVFRLAIKPVPSIRVLQKTIAKLDNGNFCNSDIIIEGRHDVCLCPRIVPVVEAMAALVLVDMALQQEVTCI